MNEREKRVTAALNAMLKACGGEIRYPASDMDDPGVIVFMPAPDDPEAMLAKRFENYDDAKAAVEAACANAVPGHDG